MKEDFTQRDAAAAVTISPLVGWLIGASAFGEGLAAADTAGLYGLIGGSCVSAVLLLAMVLHNRKTYKERAEGER